MTFINTPAYWAAEITTAEKRLSWITSRYDILAAQDAERANASLQECVDEVENLKNKLEASKRIEAGVELDANVDVYGVEF